jgi:hypothetical protein
MLNMNVIYIYIDLVMLQFKVLLVRTATAHGEYVHDFFSHFPLYLQYELTPLPDLLTN